VTKNKNFNYTKFVKRDTYRIQHREKMVNDEIDKICNAEINLGIERMVVKVLRGMKE